MLDGVTLKFAESDLGREIRSLIVLISVDVESFRGRKPSTVYRRGCAGLIVQC